MTELSLNYQLDDATPCDCDNCGHKCTAGDLGAIADAQERLYPGETIPAGECPECGACAYVIEAPKITTREAALVVALNELIGAATGAYEDARHGTLTNAVILSNARDKALATVAALFPDEGSHGEITQKKT